MKPFATWSAAAAVLLAAGSAGLALDAASRVRILYHSDTQAYYRPCG